MKRTISSIYHSFAVQLLLLHFKKFQVLLIFWWLLFSSIDGTFMKTYGLYSLYLAPEYLGHVNWLAELITGMAVGIYVMSWNITTFILFSRHFKFLATTTNPFLKYCMNNFVLPLMFLLFYLVKAIQFSGSKELLPVSSIILLILGFLSGLSFVIMISFLYFFRAD